MPSRSRSARESLAYHMTPACESGGTSTGSRRSSNKSTDHASAAIVKARVPRAVQALTACVVQVCVPWKGTMEGRSGLDNVREKNSPKSSPAAH